MFLIFFILYFCQQQTVVVIATNPECSYICDDPVCSAVCEPVYSIPKCILTPSKYAIHGLDCSVKCLNSSESSASESCPQCETTCRPPPCHPDCSIVCEQVISEWKCVKPSNCPEPICELVCESPACVDKTTMLDKRTGHFVNSHPTRELGGGPSGNVNVHRPPTRTRPPRERIVNPTVAQAGTAALHNSGNSLQEGATMGLILFIMLSIHLLHFFA